MGMWIYKQAMWLFVCGFMKGCYGATCYYLDQQTYGIHQLSCDGGCCEGHGSEEDICCKVTWSTGAIVGVCLGSVAITCAVTAVSVYVFLMMKKKRKQAVQPQSNGNTQIELQLNSNPVRSPRSTARDASSSLSHNSHDLPPPYSPSSSLHRPASGNSATSPISFINEPERLGKPALKPPPYTAQTIRSPARVGSLAPHVYTFQPSPARSLAPSRAW